MATSPNRYELDADDAERLRQLSQEVRSRLRESAQIAARAVGIDVGENAIVKFLPRKTRDDPDAGAGDWIEIIEVDGVEVCYGVIGGQPFAESPCGAGAPTIEL